MFSKGSLTPHFLLILPKKQKEKGSAWDPFGFRQSHHTDPRGAVVFYFCFGRPQLITLFIFDPTSDGYAFLLVGLNSTVKIDIIKFSRMGSNPTVYFVCIFILCLYFEK